MHTVHRNKVCEYLPVLAGLGLQVRLRIGLVAVDDEHFLMVCWRRGGLGLLVSLGCRCLLSPVHFLFVQPVDLMTLVYLPLLQHDGLLLNGLADFELHHHCAGLADFLSPSAFFAWPHRVELRSDRRGDLLLRQLLKGQRIRELHVPTQI